MIATRDTGLRATLQMAADLEHARRCGHTMAPATRIVPRCADWRTRYTSACEACGALLVVYCGQHPAHLWAGSDYPCEGVAT